MCIYMVIDLVWDQCRVRRSSSCRVQVTVLRSIISSSDKNIIILMYLQVNIPSNYLDIHDWLQITLTRAQAFVYRQQ